MLSTSFSAFQRLSAWMVHVFTATAAVMGLMALMHIHQHHYLQAMWWMAAAVIVDALDGTLARKLHVKTIIPHLDGALLDNLVDFLTYVMVPCFFLYIHPDLLPQNTAIWSLSAVIIASAYQFCQIDAKTSDHFFKGFPCYWNIILFYMLILHTPAWLNQILLFCLSILVFVPIKYVYLSRIDFLNRWRFLKIAMHGLSILYGLSYVLILLSYPESNQLGLNISIYYAIFYAALSFYCTYQTSQNYTNQRILPC